jgi:hypothetical protein
VPVYVIKEQWEVEEQLHSFLTFEMYEGEWSTSRPGHFTPVNEQVAWLVPVLGWMLWKRKKKLFPLTEFELRIVHPVA